MMVMIMKMTMKTQRLCCCFINSLQQRQELNTVMELLSWIKQEMTVYLPVQVLGMPPLPGNACVALA